MSDHLHRLEQREQALRLQFFAVALWVSAATALILAAYRFLNMPVMGWINLFIGLICIGMYALLRRRPQWLVHMANTLLLVLMIAVSGVYLVATDNALRLGVFFPLLTSALYLKGARNGAYWLAAMLLVILGGYFMPGVATGLSVLETVSACLYLTILYFVLWNFERLRQTQIEWQRESELRYAVEQRWQQAMEGVGDALWEWEQGRFHYSAGYAAMLGYAPQTLGEAEETFITLLHADDRERVLHQWSRFLRGEDGELFVSEQRMRCQDGSWKWVLCRGKVTARDAAGQAQRVVGTHVDISQRKALEAQLEHVAHYDALTGVPNRVLLADRMQQTLARARRVHSLVAVCYLDLDGFKAINDRHGHEIGDRVLVEITRRIRDTIREDDTVARLGGDEFVVLLAGLQAPEECVSSLHRLLQRIAQPIVLAPHTLTVSASIGVALYPEDEQHPDTLLRHADQAMYVAKQSGKNRFHLFDLVNDQRARLHHTLLQELRSGLQRGEFALYYQPQVDLSTRRLTGVEALVRWHHPQRGLLVPADFLRAIEGTELESELGDWVIAHAFAQLRAWREAGETFQLSVNVSAHQLQAPGFAAHLQQLMGQCCPQPCFDCLKLEILETVALEDFEHIGALIRECREIGIGFALDDFGTGYSSLTYLSHLDVDVLKIDQSFVRDMLQQPGERAIVQGIVALAKAFGRGVIAEGVETGAQWQALRDMGCDIGQGNGIAPPMPAHELLAWRERFERGEGGRL